MHTYSRAPFANGGKVTRGYSTSHRAKDIVPKLDDPGDVYAVTDGTVTGRQSGQSPGDESPNMVITKSAAGNLTVYAHVDPSVLVGANVTTGDAIGVVDMSGHSTGKHVHLARLPPGTGDVDDVETREPKEGLNYVIKGVV
jgi:murein DD-endopeptidase MepM/ murein hydrolase activator NlpD